ncbi:MAG: hypothetical protein HYZ96_02590 [Candidatus Omnitrophica bacterium]|nr:hypothetical protein [Candidatus Omnitrophota bacterium]
MAPRRLSLLAGLMGAWLGLVATPALVEAACAVPRSRQILSGFGQSRMAQLFAQSRRTRSGSQRSQFGRRQFGSPRFGSRRFGSTRFGTSRGSGLAGGRMSRLFAASRSRRFSSRRLFSLAPRCRLVSLP